MTARPWVCLLPESGFFEPTVYGGQSMVLQPGQLAPFNPGYKWFNTAENFVVPDPTITELNSYGGG